MGREATSAVGLFGAELSGRDAVRLGLAWESAPAEEVLARALELARIAARDPALSRQLARSFRTESGSPAMSWEAAVEFERGVQMWSMRRRQVALDSAGSAAG